MSQHSSIPQNHSQGKKISIIHFRDQDIYTRGLIFPNWISRYILLGFNNHVLHHQIPTMPGYQLSKIEIESAYNVNWWTWLKKAKSEKGFDLLLNEKLNIK